MAWETYCMNDWESNAYHRKKWMSVCVYSWQRHIHILQDTKIYLENKDFTSNSTVRQSMDGSLER